MTIQEAIELLKDHEYWTDFSWMDEVAEMAITALERQKEYGRHDLRKDPSDMPATNDPLLLYHSNGDLSIGWKYGKDGFATRCTTSAERASIIAWEYIEPFKGEE